MEMLCVCSVPGGRRQDDAWVRVHADQEYLLNIHAARQNRSKVSTKPSHMTIFIKQT